MSEREEHRPHRLSAGEQQRVAIARALANNPTIVLADEPTGNLDGETKFEIVNLLGKLTAEQETTIIMVTHDTQMASQAKRVLFLKDEKLLKKEKKEQPLRKNSHALLVIKEFEQMLHFVLTAGKKCKEQRYFTHTHSINCLSRLQFSSTR